MRLLPLLFWSITSFATVKVAVIDTGVDVDHKSLKDHICYNRGETGKDKLGRDKSNNGVDDDVNGFVDDVHGWNFVQNNNDLTDHYGHGTHVAGIITQYAGSADFCIIPLRYYDSKSSESNNLIDTIKAIRYATKMGADVINYSGGGLMPSGEEMDAIGGALKKGIYFVAAAGNEGADLSTHKYYPAMYGPAIVAVGSLDKNGVVLPTSNHTALNPDGTPARTDKGARIIEYELGNHVFSTLPKDQYGYMTGTSQATAVMTGGLVSRLDMVNNDKYLHILFEHKQNQKPKKTRRNYKRHRHVYVFRSGVKRWISSQADQYSEAQSKALDAAYAQSGLKADVETFEKMLEHRYVTEDVKEIEKYGAIPAYIIKAVVDKKIEIKWTW